MNKTALISVYDKTKLNIICEILKKFNINIISTSNTMATIKTLGYQVLELSSVTNYEELFEGRIKTLHPKIHGGILFQRSNSQHLKIVKQKNIPFIDFVIVNLYPFKKIIKQKKSINECIENIDIGGHALIRSAAKNYCDVTIICDPKDYVSFFKELNNNNGKTTLVYRKKLANKAFKKILDYDLLISNWLNNKKNTTKKNQLKYGENPHQKASVYFNKKNLRIFKQIQGNKLSYNNINDSICAIECIKEFSKPSAVIVKHANPCCVASDKNAYYAYVKSLKCDVQSAYGGVVIVNKIIDQKLANKILLIFTEVVMAPNFTKEALLLFKKRKDLIVLKSNSKINELKELKSIPGGFLEQDKNLTLLSKKKLKCVTKKNVNKNLFDDMLFALSVCKHLKSNAIVCVNNAQVLGIGAGQTSRIDSIKLAIKKMRKNFGKNTQFVIASDGFFPFLDNINILKNTNCKAIIQPGGSKKDKVIIDKANSLGISMYFTGLRHFKH